MKHILRLVILSFLCFSFSGCAITHKFGPYRGKVVDADTQEPIEGAVVHMDFSTSLITPAGGVSKYIGSREVLTDSEGNFSISRRYWTFRAFQVWNPVGPLLCIFKPGYATFPGNPRASISPKPAKRPLSTTQFHTILLPKLETREERLNNLDNTIVNPLALLSNSPLFLNLVNQEMDNTGLTK